MGGGVEEWCRVVEEWCRGLVGVEEWCKVVEEWCRGACANLQICWRIFKHDAEGSVAAENDGGKSQRSRLSEVEEVELQVEIERGRRWRAPRPSEEPKRPETEARQQDAPTVQAIVVCDPDG